MLLIPQVSNKVIRNNYSRSIDTQWLFFLGKIRMKAKDPRRINSTQRNKIRRFVLDNYTECGLCGIEVDKSIKTPHPLSAEVDEIIPVSLGGSPYEKDNVQLTHRYCNRKKSNKLFITTNVKIANNKTSRTW
jgi:5-methylcytosine-specific restriction endonuclease McrA